MAKKARVYTGTEWVDLASAVVDLSTSIPTGVVNPFAGDTAPVGWLMCSGGTFSATAYPALASLLGSKYGAISGDNYRLPDLRGRTVAGLDNMGGTDAGRLDLANTLGTTAGTQTHTLTSAEMPTHTHTQNAHGHSLGGGQSFGMAFGGNSGGFATFGVSLAFINSGTYQGPYSAMDTTATNQNTGGGGAHNNMQPTMLLNYIIKA